MTVQDRTAEKAYESKPRRAHALGVPGYLSILLWSFTLVICAQGKWMLLAAGACLLAASLLFPGAFRSLFRLRWLVLIVTLALVSSIRFGEQGRWITLSLDGLVTGTQMGLRSLVMLVMIAGFSESVEISQLAGLLERAGMKGLGFSLGIAVNLLPGLAQSCTAAFHALRMRGGLRAQWRQGIHLYLVTVVSNAVRRAEDTALAAEARAFSPESQRLLPLVVGRLDGWVTAAAVLSLVFFLAL